MRAAASPAGEGAVRGENSVVAMRIFIGGY
jgi:hypothetical protein